MLTEHHNTCALPDFPFQASLSFEVLIGYWERIAQKEGHPSQNFAREILHKLEKAPELRAPIKDYSILDKYENEVQMLITALIAKGTEEDELSAVISPYSSETAYVTPKFAELFGKDWTKYEDIIIKDNDVEDIVYRKTLHAYITLFKQFYGIELPLDHNILLSVKDIKTGLNKHYKVEINHKFTQIKMLKKPKELSYEQVHNLIQNAHDLELWMEYLPPSYFEFQGATMFKLMDVTVPETLSQLKYALLDKESLRLESKFETLQHMMRSMFNIPDLRLGVVAFDKQTSQLTRFGKVSHSMMLGCGHQEKAACPYALGVHEQVVKNGKPYIINDLNEIAEENHYWRNIMNVAGIQNMILAPLHYEGEFIGIMELGATKPGQLSSSYLIQIKDVIPLFSIALNRNAEERANNLESIIKRQYTAIHPAVEWRFEQAASRYLYKKERGEVAEVEPISFKDVYPLYAATDIRNSSTERNRAIQADLIEHLELVREIVHKAIEVNPLPILKGVNFKIQKHIKHITDGLFSGDEMSIITFFQEEIEPCFEHLEELMPERMGILLEEYKKKVDNKLGIVYHRRKAFEESLTRINEVVSEHVEKSQEEAQKMFPHYFEKYKTDGVEYNIYVGQSMTDGRKFNNMYLKNLRLWQLITTAEAARKTNRLKPELPVQLDTTQLILVHSNPLSIQFRLDERQFDVDGAYNIRYEIVKKRIDKAFIKDTNERLTQPHKIAIVYSQAKDAEEYKEYIEYLQSTGDLLDEVEDVELEPLQGVQGLRALRVNVNLAKSEEIDITEEEKLAKAV